MPSLAQLTSAETDPTLLQFVGNTVAIEPLDGPTSVDDVMDRFPEEVYQQGRDTHLYRFLQALGGDAGAGLVKKQTFAARLRFEAEFMNFQILDEFYAAQFRLNRLKSETYTFNAAVDALTPTQWDQVQLADQSYRHRVQEFFAATRYGTSPEGMALAAQAGSGIESEIVEHYRYIFDQYSDDKLGLEPEGTTVSTAEFVIVPRFLNDTEDVFDQDYEQTWARSFSFTPPVLATGARPVPAPVGADVLKVTLGYHSEPQTRLLPEIERNVVDLLDRLRPVGAMATIKPEDIRYSEIAIQGDPFASSERIHVSRLVEGNANVPWPDVSPSENFFIEAGAENEAGFYYGAQRDLPVVFHTIESANAYSDGAFSDPLYGTNEFYDSEGGISAYDSYRSEHHGQFSPLLSALFPFLATTSVDNSFIAGNAVAIIDTPLVLEGAAV